MQIYTNPMRQLPPSSNPCFGFADSPFGNCCFVYSDEGICSLIFPESEESAYFDMTQRFPETIFKQDNDKAQQLSKMIFHDRTKLTVNPIGTDFQLAVWAALGNIPVGSTTTYTKIAEAIGRPKAVRAVGTAIGANPIAFLIPCHRVIRSDGSMGGFRWGLDVKKKMLDWEKVR